MRPLTASMYARLNVERTHTRETRGSRFLNNAHVLYRKCLFIVRMKYSARTYRIEWKLHALPPLVLSCALEYGNYHGRLIGKALNGLHSNVLLGQITISNTRSKRVNENITRQCTRQEENMYTCKFSCLLEFRLLRYCTSTGRRRRRRSRRSRRRRRR